MKHLNVFPEIPEMFNQIFRISNINQNCCQWKVGLLAQDFWVIKTDLLVVKRCYFPEFHCGRAGEGTAHGSCGFYRYPVIISKISRCTLRFYSTPGKCQGEVLKGTQGSTSFLLSLNISGTCVSKCLLKIPVWIWAFERFSVEQLGPVGYLC